MLTELSHLIYTTMKKLIFLTILIAAIGASGLSQIYEGENGLYYASNDLLYHGSYLEKYENGIPKMEMTLKNGLLNGYVKIYFESGKLNEVRAYKMGQKDGNWITYNENGVKTGEANYKNDKKDGIWLIYDENGTLRSEMFYIKGEKTGIWKQYNESGQLIAEQSFDN
jgi:antitoxin component YwqK of YwqJK toxin-antitoxin module